MLVRRLGASLASVALLLSLGCTPQGEAPAPTAPPKVDSKLNPINPAMAPAKKPAGGKAVLIVSNATSPFWESVRCGMTAGSQEFGVDANLQLNDGTVEGQIRKIEEAIAKKDSYLGIAISAIRPDAAGLLAALRKAKEAGLPVVTVDSDCAKDARVAFIGTNNSAAGEALGKKAAEILPGGGKTCVFVGEPSAQNAKERIDGFFKGAGPAFSKLEVYQDEVKPDRARSNVEGSLTKYPDVKALVGIWSYNGPVIGETVKSAGKLDKIKVICFDAEPNLLPLVENGTVAATCVQNPYEFGRLSVQLVQALAKKDKAVSDKLLGGKDVVDVPVRIITKANYAEFKADLDKKGLKGS